MPGYFIPSAARRIPKCVAIILWMLLGAVGAFAETKLTGRVLDPQGKAVAGARVRLLGASGSPSVDARTNEQGAYQFDDAAPGLYRLTAEGPGAATSN